MAKKIKRVLIANRGEIALRILRTCKEMDIETVCVYSEADRDNMYLRHATHAICIGPTPSTESYLSINRIIAAAELADVDAIHPGYGFLAENDHFAEICRDCAITFIGPSPESMAMLGDKNSARALARQADVPLLGGSDDLIQTEEEAVAIAEKIGYPVIIKATAGGGGRGMRVAHNEITLVQGVRSARVEAEKSFGNPGIYVERFLENPRHVEVQFIRDTFGNAVYLGDRDCTLQRRHQKLVEEAPSSFIDEETRKAMGEATIRMAEAANYHSVGTAEYLVDSNRNFYFLEVNTRIQVEHTVTEEVTGLDLIAEMIRVAQGEKLSFTQDDIQINGHAIECRINAEDPMRDFAPSPGKITLYSPSAGRGIRVDSHVYGGYTVPPSYDSLLAKLIVHRDNRKDAIKAMRNALDEFIVEGIETTIPLHSRLMAHRRFHEGDYDTSFVEKAFANLSREKK